MKLSTKGRYGLRAMIDLAVYSEKEPVSIQSIADRQNISERYLEQLMASLKKEGLVKSIRGANGGYQLARPAIGISVGDILRALEGDLASSNLSGKRRRRKRWLRKCRSVCDAICMAAHQRRNYSCSGYHVSQPVGGRE